MACSDVRQLAALGGELKEKGMKTLAGFRTDHREGVIVLLRKFIPASAG